MTSISVDTSSCECKKIVSAFLSFCRRSHFVFWFLLLLLCSSYFAHKTKLLWLQIWKKMKCVFLLAFCKSTKKKHLFLHKMQILRSCIHMTNCFNVIDCMQSVALCDHVFVTITLKKMYKVEYFHLLYGCIEIQVVTVTSWCHPLSSCNQWNCPTAADEI